MRTNTFNESPPLARCILIPIAFTMGILWDVLILAARVTGAVVTLSVLLVIALGILIHALYQHIKTIIQTLKRN